MSSQSIVDTVSNNLRRLNTEEILPGATNFLSSNYEVYCFFYNYIFYLSYNVFTDIYLYLSLYLKNFLYSL